ncbi:MAG: hypothetical protein MUD07_11295 [Burkholderiaceae bacterium]|jgi:hypothetical protein|nr:hypothetical protein [Burkholderiaceae bacterium]
MSTPQEPRDGNFVAYIDALQRESAARLEAQSRVPMVELTGRHAPRAGGAIDTAPVLNRQQAEELRQRLAHASATMPATAGIVLATGAVLMIAAMIFDLGVVPVFFGLGLMAWGFSRLRRSRAAAGGGMNRQTADASRIFGSPPPPT